MKIWKLILTHDDELLSSQSQPTHVVEDRLDLYIAYYIICYYWWKKVSCIRKTDYTLPTYLAELKIIKTCIPNINLE